MTATDKLKEQIQRTNVIYDLTRGLSTEELRALTPALLRAAIPMRNALKDAEIQIEYLHDKFHETGTGNTILARISCALSLAKEGKE